jgi:hypothetical protein
LLTSLFIAWETLSLLLISARSFHFSVRGGVPAYQIARQGQFILPALHLSVKPGLEHGGKYPLVERPRPAAKLMYIPAVYTNRHPVIKTEKIFYVFSELPAAVFYAQEKYAFVTQRLEYRIYFRRPGARGMKPLQARRAELFDGQNSFFVAAAHTEPAAEFHRLDGR